MTEEIQEETPQREMDQMTAVFAVLGETYFKVRMMEENHRLTSKLNETLAEQASTMRAFIDMKAEEEREEEERQLQEAIKKASARARKSKAAAKARRKAGKK